MSNGHQVWFCRPLKESSTVWLFSIFNCWFIRVLEDFLLILFIEFFFVELIPALKGSSLKKSKYIKVTFLDASIGINLWPIPIDLSNCLEIQIQNILCVSKLVYHTILFITKAGMYHFANGVKTHQFKLPIEVDNFTQFKIQILHSKIMTKSPQVQFMLLCFLFWN